MTNGAEGSGGGGGRALERLLPLVDPAVDVIAMAGHIAVLPTHLARRLVSPVMAVVVRVPATASRRNALAASLRRHGGRVRNRFVVAGATRVDVLVPALVEQLLDRLDLTEVVRRHVDLDRLVGDVDVDAIAARLDLDQLVSAALAQVDLAAVAHEVVAAMDLPEIIRDSSSALRSDTLRGARVRSAAADQALGRVRDRFLLRPAPAPAASPPPPGRP